MQQLDRITQQPDLMGGKACIRGMHVTVGMVEPHEDSTPFVPRPAQGMSWEVRQTRRFARTHFYRNLKR